MMALCRRPEKNKQRKRKQRMTSNRAFAIRLLNSTNPIIINTHITPERTGREFPLAIVSDLIQAFFPNNPPNELGNYTLKLPDGTALAGNKLLSTIDADSWNWDRPLVIESNTPAQFVTGPTGLTFSVRKTANFDIYYPVDLDENVVTSLSWLSVLLEQSDFLNTFNVKEHDILKTIASKKLRIRVIAPKEYNNNIRSYADKDRFAGPEYGWYDASIAPDTIYINQNYYRIHDSTTLQHLQFLAIVTAIHELQHFLVHHLDLESPNQPIPSMQPPETESGDYWEFHNLGGRLGIVSRKETPEDFIGLYLIGLDEMNREFHTMVSDGFIDAVLQDVSSGRNAFPKRLGHIEPVPASYIKSKILHKCNDVDDNRGNHDLKLNEGFLKPVRKPDKKPYVK